MSIPTPFNPMGTLGAVNELPYVQPIMDSDTSYVATGSFGVRISYLGVNPGVTYGGWILFANNMAYKEHRMSVNSNGTVLNFEKPIKISSFKINHRIFDPDGRVELWGMDNGGTLLGSCNDMTTSSIDYNYEVTRPEYHKKYELRLICDKSKTYSVGFVYGAKYLRLEAVYRP